jgi:predicted AAA+ superfamily ATPase
LKRGSANLLPGRVFSYLREEILAETLVRDLQGFSHFLNAVAENSGLFLDFSKLAQKARVHRSSARRFYEILEDTLICDRLESYFDPDDPDLSKKLVKHPKYYLFDVGIKNGILQNFSPSKDRIGFLYEHLFFNQIKNISYSLDQEIKVSHFRTHTGLELDFIFKGPNQSAIVELKTSEPSPDEVKKVKHITKEFNLRGDIYFACINCKPKKISKTKILPWQDVLNPSCDFKVLTKLIDVKILKSCLLDRERKGPGKQTKLGLSKKRLSRWQSEKL